MDFAIRFLNIVGISIALLELFPNAKSRVEAIAKERLSTQSFFSWLSVFIAAVFFGLAFLKFAPFITAVIFIVILFAYKASVHDVARFWWKKDPLWAVFEFLRGIIILTGAAYALAVVGWFVPLESLDFLFRPVTIITNSSQSIPVLKYIVPEFSPEDFRNVFIDFNQSIASNIFEENNSETPWLYWLNFFFVYLQAAKALAFFGLIVSMLVFLVSAFYLILFVFYISLYPFYRTAEAIKKKNNIEVKNVPIMGILMVSLAGIADALMG